MKSRGKKSSKEKSKEKNSEIEHNYERRKAMLDIIRSNKSIKIIFSFLNEKIKYKIILYNKACQKRLNISIENVKNYLITEIEIIPKENTPG